MAETPLTIPAFFAKTVAEHGDEPALGYFRGGELCWLSWNQLANRAASLADAMQGVCNRSGRRVFQVRGNCPRWVVLDLAIHLVQGVHVPIHTTLSPEQIAEQVAVSDARFGDVPSDEIKVAIKQRVDMHTSIFVDGPRLVAKIAEGHIRESKKGLHPSAKERIESAAREARLDDLATILFTSGTTGRPRGVMLSQRNLASNAMAMAEAYGAFSDQVRLNILPFSHIYARTCDLYTWVINGSQLVLGESRETLARDCQLARPTTLNAVPYVYQRIAERVRASGAENEGAALREFFGGRIHTLTCGGAGIAPEVEAWYAECGLPVLPGYGMTESSPVITVSAPTAHRLGTVGRPLRDVEVRIAEDGEVLARGPNVMMGYWQDEAATADILRDSWLHTGDLGELDTDGFLTIRGRKKELIVLSTGKKVSPTRVESLLTASPLIEQAAVFGDGRSALVALVVAAGSHPEGTRQRAGNEEMRSEISRCLASAAHEEQVRNFVVLDRPFSIERGELTAKMSLCRAVIARNFASELATADAAVSTAKSAAPGPNS